MLGFRFQAPPRPSFSGAGAGGEGANRTSPNVVAGHLLVQALSADPEMLGGPSTVPIMHLEGLLYEEGFHLLRAGLQGSLCRCACGGEGFQDIDRRRKQVRTDQSLVVDSDHDPLKLVGSVAKSVG